MSFLTGGLIFKNGAALSDEAILATLRREKYGYTDNINMEAALAGNFEGIGIARIDDMVLVLNRNITHSCSFDEHEVSKLDERIASLSAEGEILCFLINSVSDTYAWSLFKNGSRARGKSAAAGVLLSDFGQPTKYEEGMGMSEQGMIKLIEKFTGYPYLDLVFEKQHKVLAYYK
jgi:hypothetical protein